MNNKVLIIPDIHGLDFWKEPCYNWDGIIIFLGDYVDPYYGTSKKTAKHNLEDLVNFKKNTKCTCRFLLGNHDHSYISGLNPCRFDYYNKDIISALFNELELSLCVVIKNYVFSHAGFTNAWLGDKDFLNEEFVVPNAYKELPVNWLQQVPYSRNGESVHGSCLWNDVSDFQAEEHHKGVLENTYQIFGHSWGGRIEPIINDDFAMLDCHKAFALDLFTGKIQEYNEAILSENTSSSN